MNKHMPGPWFYTFRRGHRVVTESFDREDERCVELVARVSGVEANAHLVAAAPELYEAAKALLERLNHLKSNAAKHIFHKQFDDLANAIAKAEGKS